MGFFDDVAGAAGSLIGGIINKDASRKAAGLNRDMQREFAQNGIRWKVADAKAAGLHPLAALGASTTSFSPSFVGDTSMGQAMANIGQDISRSIQATRTAQERAQANALAIEAAKLDLEKKGMENELLRRRIAGQGDQIGPPLPGAQVFPVPDSYGDVHAAFMSGGSVPRGTINVVPAEIISSRTDDYSTTAGRAPGLTEYDFGSAGKWKGMSQGASEAFEDMDLAKYAILGAANWGQLNAPLWGSRRIEAEKPDWVRRIEQSEGVVLEPYRDWKGIFWKPSRRGAGYVR